MTSVQRWNALLKGEKQDRIAVMPFATTWSAIPYGASIGDFYSKIDVNYKCQRLCRDCFDYEWWPRYSYAAIGAWEFGGELKMPYAPGMGAPAVLRNPVMKPEDVDNLQIPEPSKAGSVPLAMENAKKNIALGEPGVTAMLGGTITWGAGVCDVKRLCLWMIRQPQLVHKVLKKVTEFQQIALDWYVNTLGAENLHVAMGTVIESNKLISEKQFETFGVPYEKIIWNKITSAGVPSTWLHACSDQNKNFPHYVHLRESCGWKSKFIWSFGPENPLEKQIEAFGKHDPLMGTVDPVSMVTKRYDDIIALAKDNIERGIKNPSGYALGVGCGLPPMAPPINVFALKVAARKYGSFE